MFIKSQLGANPYPTIIAGSRFTGNVFAVDPIAGSDGNDGSLAHPFQTLAQAQTACLAGHNDVVIIISDGTAGSSVRLSAGFTWSKNATHLIGVCSGSGVSNRARIAPTLGITAFANFFTVTANGCYFQDIEFFHGFTAGTAAEICMAVTGGRNVFKNCSFGGMGDTDGAGAQDTGSRNLKISGTTGENLFDSCVIGLDTIARTVANASVELAGGTPRNRFVDCAFPIWATNAAVLGILGTGAACIDRFNLFRRCDFINSIKSGSGTAMTALVSLTNAAPGGLLLFHDCVVVGATKWGDTNALANSYIDMPAVSAAAGGLAVNPS